MMSDEKVIRGFNQYKINKMGIVFYKDTRIIVKSHPCRNGYRRVWIKTNNGKQKAMSVHRLVAKAFIPNSKRRPCINHKDGDKNNNFYQNLEWITHSTNTQHAYKTGLMKGVFNQHSKRDEVLKYLSKKYSKGEIAEFTGMNYANICRILRTK